MPKATQQVFHHKDGGHMKYLSAEEARKFAEQWLPAWSGNHPERLADF